MKNLILGLVLVTGLSAQAASNCEEHDIRAKVKSSVNSLVGTPAGGSDQILKITNIDILTTEDDAGNIKTLYSFEESIGTRIESAALFKMKGYAKFKKVTCEQVDGLVLGSTPAP